MIDRRLWPFLAGIGCTAGALLHVAVAASGNPDWYNFFEAPPAVVQSAREGSWAAPVTTLIIAALMQLAGLFAFSAAKTLPRLPLLKTALVTLAMVGILRALVIIPIYFHPPPSMPPFRVFDGIAALIWGAIGVFFLIGAWQTIKGDLMAGRN